LRSKARISYLWARKVCPILTLEPTPKEKRGKTRTIM
jgi:hypothetical protein